MSTLRGVFLCPHNSWFVQTKLQCWLQAKQKRNRLNKMFIFLNIFCNMWNFSITYSTLWFPRACRNFLFTYSTEIFQKKSLSVTIFLSSYYFYIIYTDNDECFDGQFPCDDTQICSNTPGSFECTCADGQKFEDGICQGWWWEYSIKLWEHLSCPW